MKCNSCEGLGYFEISGFCSIDVENTCPSCNGTGKQPEEIVEKSDIDKAKEALSTIKGEEQP